jgi:hypothetical protein
MVSYRSGSHSNGVGSGFISGWDQPQTSAEKVVPTIRPDMGRIHHRGQDEQNQLGSSKMMELVQAGSQWTGEVTWILGRRLGPNSSSRNGRMRTNEINDIQRKPGTLPWSRPHWLPPKGETCHQRYAMVFPLSSRNEWSNSRAVSVLVHDDDQWALIGLNHCTAH